MAINASEVARDFLFSHRLTGHTGLPALAVAPLRLVATGDAPWLLATPVAMAMLVAPQPHTPYPLI